MTTSAGTFRPVKRDAPCEVCGKGDWCRRADDGAIECHREAGEIAGFKRLKVTESNYGLYRRSDDPVLAQSNRPANRPPPPPARKEPPAAPKPAAFKSIEDYERSLGNRHGGTWHYEQADGTPAMAVVRINKPEGGKEFRPLHPVADGWAFGDPPGKLPLYRLPALQEAHEAPVYIFEGEKCADLAAACELVSTTTAHGSNSAGKSDFTPLAGRECYLVPDNDKAGENYVACVARILTSLNPPARVKIVRLELEQEGDDFEQFKQPRTPSEVRRDLEELIEAAPWYEPTPDNAPPPTDSLPEDPGPPWLLISELPARHTYRQGLIPVTTGIESIDEILGGGVRPETLTTLGGRTGSAKSTLAANIVRLSALAGNCVLYLALEESITEKGWRIHAAASQVHFRVLLSGANKAGQADRDKLNDGWSLIRNLPIRFSDARDLEAICRIAKQHADAGGRLIVIDQLSMIQVAGADIGFQKTTITSNRLRMLAVETRLPIVLVAQVSREASKSKDALTANSLRDSGELENDSANVLMINKVRTPDAQWRGAEPVRELEILVAKNRYGATTYPDEPLVLTWYPATCRIEQPNRPGRGVA